MYASPMVASVPSRLVPRAIPIRLNDESAPPIPLGVLLRRLMRLAWSHKAAAAPAVIITVFAQVFTLISLSGQGIAIDLLRRRADPEAPDPHWPFGLAPDAATPFMRQIFILAGVILVASLFVGLLRFLQRLADEFFVQACVVDLRTTLYHKLQRLDFSFFDAHDTGEIIQRLTADAQSVRAFIQGVMIRLLITIITFGVFLFFMLREHTTLTLVCLAVLPIQAFVMGRFAKRVKPAFIKQGKLVDRYVHYFQESIAGVRVIRTFARETERAEGARERIAEARDHRIHIDRIRATHVPVVLSSSVLSMGVLLAFGGYLVILGPAQGGIALGTLWVFRGLLERLGAQTEAIAMVAASAPESLAGAERVYRLLDYPELIADVAHQQQDHELRGAIEFRGVSFGYAPEQPILHDITFRAEPGETIAIVGPTGAGKSTLLSLIPRFYDPDQGSILIDDIDAREFPLHTLRAGVGMVFQEPFLFSNTIRNNIAFGVPEAELDRLANAVEAACASDVIAERTDGYDTIIGERGVSLSGGQRQRLTIARALVKQPRILILDDATGAVDPITESRIQRALDDSLGNATTFIVAHRLSTLRRADRIIVLDEGRIVDIGTHESLMNKPGHYRAAALIQLALDQDGPQDGNEDASATTPTHSDNTDRS